MNFRNKKILFANIMKAFVEIIRILDNTQITIRHLFFSTMFGELSTLKIFDNIKNIILPK